MQDARAPKLLHPRHVRQVVAHAGRQHEALGAHLTPLPESHGKGPVFLGSIGGLCLFKFDRRIGHELPAARFYDLLGRAAILTQEPV